MQIYRFRNCLLNTAERCLLKDNDCLELTTKTFDVLQYLVENAGKVLPKDQILGTVWEGNFVEESNLPVHISKLRKVLGDNNENRFIETIQGTGYRFIAPVKDAPENEWRIARASEFPLPAVETPRSIKAVAVLPLVNKSTDRNNDYLTDGITEGLINDLTHIAGLKVIARDTVFRYKGRKVEIRTLGELLGVGMVVGGRVQEGAEGLVLYVELINIEDGSQVWGSSYPLQLTNLLNIQRKIAFAIVENLVLSVRRSDHRFGAALTRDPESYRLYLKGRYFLERYSEADLYKAINFFQESTLLDPGNVFSYAEIVECYRLLHSFDYLSYEEFVGKTDPLRLAVSKGDQNVDAVHIVYCNLEMMAWRFDEAADHCRKALSINPNSLRARLRYSDLLLQSRNFSAALEQMEKTLKVDPLSANVYSRIARTFYLMGESKTAIAYLNDAIELEPNSYQALTLRGAAHTELEHYDKALKDFNSSLNLHHNVETLAMTGVVFARLGRELDAQEVLKRVVNESNNNSQYSIKLAYIYLALGQKNECYDALERAYSQHESDFRALTYDPRWKSIRGEERFKALVERVGLPSIIEE